MNKTKLAYYSKLSEAILKSPMEIEEGDDTPILYFVRGSYSMTQTDIPVMSRPRIGREPMPIPGRFMWDVEVFDVIPATRESPEDGDLVNIGQVESVEDGIKLIAHNLLDCEISNIMEGVFMEELLKQEEY